MSDKLLLVLVIVGVALAFDFLNGFHDAANSVATVVATRVLTPLQAVIWAAFFNFVSAFSFGTGVAKTVGKGMVDLSSVTPYVILCGLIGAVFWDLITWWFGLPTSSSHALFGGYAGAAIARASSFHVLIWSGWIKTLLFMALAPLIGLIAAHIFMTVGLLAVSELEPQEDGHLLPQAPAPVRRSLQLLPRHQRRTEDHGHHHRRPGARRST